MSDTENKSKSKPKTDEEILAELQQKKERHDSISKNLNDKILKRKKRIQKKREQEINERNAVFFEFMKQYNINGKSLIEVFYESDVGSRFSNLNVGSETVEKKKVKTEKPVPENANQKSESSDNANPKPGLQFDDVTN